MPSFISPGTNVTTRIAFNSGTLDFGNDRLVQLQNCSISWEASIADIYTLGSILRQDIARHSIKVMLSGKLLSYAPQLEMLALGSSTTGTPQEIDVLDGQPTLQNPVLTIFDRNNKEIQYQVVGALFKSVKISTTAEQYAEWEFDLEAKNLVELYTA